MFGSNTTTLPLWSTYRPCGCRSGARFRTLISTSDLLNQQVIWVRTKRNLDRGTGRGAGNTHLQLAFFAHRSLSEASNGRLTLTCLVLFAHSLNSSSTAQSLRWMGTPQACRKYVQNTFRNKHANCLPLKPACLKTRREQREEWSFRARSR